MVQPVVNHLSMQTTAATKMKKQKDSFVQNVFILV